MKMLHPRNSTVFAILLTALALVVTARLPVQAASGFLPFPSPPPAAPVRPVTETYFGTSVTDPYRYMENMSDPQVQQFFREQNSYARAVLAKLGAPRQALFNRIKVLDNAGESVGSLQRVKNLYFYEKLKPGQNSDKLYVRVVGSAHERVLVDPDRLASAGKHYTINYFTPSLDGKYVAYGISEGGSESSVIHVVDVSTGRVLPDAIDRAYFVGVTSWLPDGKSFYYVRFPQLKPGEPDTDKETRAVNYLHVLGRNPDQDPAVAGYGVDPKVPFAETDFPFVVYSPVSKYSLLVVVHGVKNEQVIYALDRSPVMTAGAPWKKIVDDADEVTGFDIKGSTLYLLTHHDAPTFKVVEMSLAAPNFAAAKPIVNPTRAVVEAAQVASDGLYVLARDGGFGRISRVRLNAAGNATNATTVLLPYTGSIGGIVTDSRMPGVTFGLTGWTRSLRYFYAAANGNVVDTRLKKPASVNMSAYTSQEVLARSSDGTMVPLSLVYKKGIKRDGTHPVYLEGYGAYGITLEPAFSTTRVAWMERGGVYAICHPRGGGWYGEAWHQAGMIATKHHTWEDFIACGQWLVDNHYTSPQHLAGEGTSAGGITIGRAITTRPDLFAAAL
ncbi:MAG: prolyl oligopeptidase family serine peptidase, partial [Candidatus Eremiobacteraeota bacterium]|nr:prolyl oligopeptidase family serine peptidase [Candidatus Eremiobacteraeota bacterium]